MTLNGYEIDFIPVGTGQKNGDAITIRVRRNGKDVIYVIDGGTKESGEAIVEHIKKYYNTNVVDYLINTHPDMDHVSGLTVVAEELEVKEIWMHQPWNYSEKIINKIKDGRVTEKSLETRIQESLNQAKLLEDIAVRKKIPIKEPFEGENIGDFKVLSPSKKWYIDLLENFNGIPETTGESKNEGFINKVVKTINMIKESWNIETLTEDGETSAQNESSVVLFGDLPNKKILLTGDAGIQALSNAITYSENNYIDLKECNFIQIPHHGGRRNITPSLLDKIIGHKVPYGTSPTKIAFVNVSSGYEEYPKKSVTNAFLRRGVKVCVTRGNTICHRDSFPSREGWRTVTPIEFQYEVEE